MDISAPLLMPHQDAGAAWLLAQGAGLLAFEAGTGKTISALEAVKRRDARRILIVMPASLLDQWHSEIIRWGYGEDVYQMTGGKAEREAVYRGLAHPGALVDMAPSGRVFILTSYERFRLDAKAAYGVAWDAVILDETLKIQSPTALMTKAVLLMPRLPGQLRIALNGTPYSNGWGDIWATVSWLAPGTLYRTWWQFRTMHAIVNPYFHGITGWRGVDEIKSKIKPHIMTVRKTDVLSDLPEKTEIQIPVTLSKKEFAVYHRIKEELILEWDGEDTSLPNIIVKMMRLRQCANGLFAFPGHGEVSSKLDVLGDVLEPLFQASLPVVVFSEFEETANRVAQQYGLPVISGRVSQKDRAQIVEDFNAGKVKGIVGTRAMALGLNLQAASHLVNVDLPFSYAQYDQRIGRVWRHGQKNAVTVYNLMANNTVDFNVWAILARKLSGADELASVTRADVDEILST
ncbi:MAG TPA: DEAD/DEAH box helicase [Nitrospira sp.]|nr:DEAD/DEAH box helicase [Nitrospira sp.]